MYLKDTLIQCQIYIPQENYVEQMHFTQIGKLDDSQIAFA